MLYNTGTVKVDSAHGLITTVAYQFGPKEPPTYALEGSVAVAGAAISWLKDGLSVISDATDAQQLAEQAELAEGGDVYFVPAFSGLYAPYWRQDARGYKHDVFTNNKSLLNKFLVSYVEFLETRNQVILLKLH